MNELEVGSIVQISPREPDKVKNSYARCFFGQTGEIVEISTDYDGQLLYKLNIGGVLGHVYNLRLIGKLEPVQEDELLELFQ